MKICVLQVNHRGLQPAPGFIIKVVGLLDNGLEDAPKHDVVFAPFDKLVAPSTIPKYGYFCSIEFLDYPLRSRQGSMILEELYTCLGHQTFPGH